MRKKIDPGKTDVLLLCGGKGERLKSVVKDRPKPMAEVKGRPFLDILINYLLSFGFRRIILCLGYKGEVIRQYYSKKRRLSNILFSQETRPLGTAGAVKNAESLVKSDPFLVMNGDSFCLVDLCKFVNFYNGKNATFAMALAKAGKGRDYGVVGMDGSRRIVSFNEKARARDGNFMNAGIYLLKKRVLRLIKAGRKSSLEYDIFPKVLNERFYGYLTEEKLIDIGTPERYAKAKKYLSHAD